jgi:hypothetical protein
MRFFEDADLVTEPSSFFVFLGVDGKEKLFFEVFETLFTGFFVVLARDFTFVVEGFLSVFEDVVEGVVEGVVAIGATEATGFFEFVFRIATGWTRKFFILSTLRYISAHIEEKVGEGETAAIGHAHLFGAAFAKVDLLHLAADDLSEEDGGFVALTFFALHKLLIL